MFKHQAMKADAAVMMKVQVFLTSAMTRVNHSTRSPFVTLLSRSAQSRRWSSFRKRVWFTESHI